MAVSEESRPVVVRDLRKEEPVLKTERLNGCYQCQKCTNGCPVAFAMDLAPHKIVHLLNLGLTDRVLRSNSIWLCTSCQTCVSRCPNSVDLPRVIDTLRQTARRQSLPVPQPAVPIFHRTFLESIERHGRVHETELVLRHTVRNEGWPGILRLARLGLTMFLKGKIKLKAHRVRALNQVRSIFRDNGSGAW